MAEDEIKLVSHLKINAVLLYVLYFVNGNLFVTKANMSTDVYTQKIFFL
jgi:hypothetical protein